MRRIKKNLNSRFLPNWMLLIFVIVVVILAVSGWKITYAPGLENNWSAIDAIGGWASAIVSGVAIWFAACVPKRIAQEQNKISLFEKRFLSYSVFLKYTAFAETLRSVNTPGQLRQTLLYNFMEYTDTIEPKELILMIKNDEKQLMSGLFLFSDFCNGNTIHDILQAMLEVAKLLQCEQQAFSKEDKAIIVSFCDKCKSFADNYMGKMRGQMTIRDV